MDKLSSMDDGIDTDRSQLSLSQKEIKDHFDMIREMQKKLQKKVECETFDKEVNYLKSLLTHLRK